MHNNGGGVEIKEWGAKPDEMVVKVKTKWQIPVKITVAYPTANSFSTNSGMLTAGQKEFRIRKP